MFLLDTDHLVILQQETQPEVHVLGQRMAEYPPTDFYVSIVTFHEQVAGWAAYLNRARTLDGIVRAYGRFQRILDDFATSQVLPFDEAAARAFESLRGQHVRIGTMDLRIACVALTRDITVLSRNLVDFRKVRDLRVEDWTVR